MATHAPTLNAVYHAVGMYVAIPSNPSKLHRAIPDTARYFLVPEVKINHLTAHTCFQLPKEYPIRADTSLLSFENVFFHPKLTVNTQPSRGVNNLCMSRSYVHRVKSQMIYYPTQIKFRKGFEAKKQIVRNRRNLWVQQDPLTEEQAKLFEAEVIHANNNRMTSYLPRNTSNTFAGAGM
jgi:hypothetical protein